MNILFIKHFFVGFMVSGISRVSVFGHYPYSVTFPYTRIVDKLIDTITNTFLIVIINTNTNINISTILIFCVNNIDFLR